MKTFYEHQEVARANSAQMMGLMLCAVGGTTLLTGLVITIWLFVPLYVLYLSAFPRPETVFTIHLHPDAQHPVQRMLVEYFPWTVDFPWELFGFFYLVITVATGAAIWIVTKNKLFRLWPAGGVGVAHSLGALHITAAGYPADDRTRRAINVVREIAIAAKVPPPEVFLLHDEPGINAFTLGLTHADMAMGLTAGCVSELSREQLQGIVAHEFSHITNGDTRTNVLLVGYLHGIMGIIICAQSLLDRGTHFMVKSISHGGAGVIGIALIIGGALLWPVGLAGLCFATVVKAAYSRQRDFLADAAAVEYSRNQVGLVTAIQRILGYKHGSHVRSARCLSISHAFFARSCGGIAGLIDSHVPLEKRILRLNPNWQGEIEFEEEHDVGQFTGVLKGTMSIAQRSRATTTGRILDATDAAGELEVVEEVVMNVNEHAARIRESLPPQLWELSQDLPAAEAMVFALWSAGTTEKPDDDIELHSLGEASSSAHRVADALKPHIDSYGLAERLMLFDAAVNRIRRGSEETDLTRFCRKAQKLIAHESNDDDLFRWAWRKTMQRIVDRELEAERPRPQFRDVDEVLEECRVLLSALAYANDSQVMEGYSLLRAGNVLEHDLELLPRPACRLEDVEAVLSRLQLLAPKARRTVLLACSASIETDGVMNDAEALLMRGICSGLGYPPATVLPGQPVKLN